MLFVVLSAALLTLSYPPFDCGWLAWGALVPWLLSLEHVPPEGGISLDKNFKEITPRQAFLRSYLLGLLFFGATIWWLGIVTVIGTILLVAYLALYFGVWGWLAQRILIKSGVNSQPLILLGLPAAWALLEYVRSILLTGFGWNLLAHTQWHWIPLIQVADLTGVYGVSFLVVLVNVALWQAARRRSLSAVFWAGLLLLATWVYGSIHLQQIDRPSSTSCASFTVSVVQGNIPQREKWDEAFAEAIWKRYEALTLDAAKAHPDLIVWPETAVPGYLEELEVMNRLRQIVRTTQTFFLVGAPAGNPGEFEIFAHVFNDASLLSPDGTFLGRYDKIHLVPFGEYVPLGPVSGWLRRFVVMGDFSPGQEFTVFRPSMGKGKVPPFSVLICFEDLFPGLCRHFIQEGAQWLLVITNDAWFGRSSASLEHLQASVFRAIENRVWVARAANTGWSGFIDPTGRLLGQIPRFKPGVVRATLRVCLRRPTPYARFGDWFEGLCLILVGFAFFPFRRSV